VVTALLVLQVEPQAVLVLASQALQVLETVLRVQLMERLLQASLQHLQPQRETDVRGTQQRAGRLLPHQILGAAKYREYRQSFVLQRG
jgi:hypothetical protein